MKRLALFDIDKTLLRVYGAHFRAFSSAFKKVYGIDTHIGNIRHDGMTDQQIIIEILKNEGLSEQVIENKMGECMEAIVSFFDEDAELEKVVVMDGARELLEELQRKDVLMGLVTGNLEAIALAKVGKAGIGHYFKVGGYGSDDRDRAQLVRLAVQRAEKHFDFDREGEVFLFGDALQDIRAGKEAGVRTIGVTTGIFSKEQLYEAGADSVLDDLKDSKEIMKRLFS